MNTRLLCFVVSIRFFGGSNELTVGRIIISVSSSKAGLRRFLSRSKKYTIFSVLCLNKKTNEIYLNYSQEKQVHLELSNSCISFSLSLKQPRLVICRNTSGSMFSSDGITWVWNNCECKVQNALFLSVR